METEIITIYVICDEFLRAINHHEDKQIEMSDAEVMTTALIAMLKYGGNYAQAARRQLADHRYIPNIELLLRLVDSSSTQIGPFDIGVVD